MGFLRGFAKAIVGIMFLLMISALIANITFYETTKEANMRILVTDAITKSMGTQDIGPLYADSLKRCSSALVYSPPIEGMNLSIDCSKIKNSSKDNFLGLLGDAIFNSVYERPCSDASCLQLSGFPGFATRSFNSFLFNLLTLTAIVTAIFAVLVFILSDGWPSKFISIGTPLLLTGLPAIPLKLVKINVPEFQFLIDSMSSVIADYLLYFLVAGAVMIFIGIVIKITEKYRLKNKSEKKSDSKKSKKLKGGRK